MAVAFGVATAVAGSLLLVVWAAGGLDTSGGNLDWGVVSSLATVVGALAAVGALGSVAYGVEQLRQTRRTERISLTPYLRVDVGFLEDEAHHPGFTPPDCKYLFEAADFGAQLEKGDLQSLEPAAGQPGMTLCLWATNQQRAPLGVAYDIEVGLYVVWKEGEGEQVTEVRAEFAYLEPGQTTGIKLGSVRASVEGLIVHVFAVSYRGMFLDHELLNRHGALSLYYDAKEGVIQDDRSYGLGEFS